MLKYLARHPVEKVTIGGGLGKLTKLAQGAIDLHSGRSQRPRPWGRRARFRSSPWTGKA